MISRSRQRLIPAALLLASLASFAAPAALAAPVAARGREKQTEQQRARYINPCMTPDPGFGDYEQWDRNITMGQALIPKTGGVTSSGGFDLLIHFHGHHPIRKEFVPVGRGIVLVGIDLGIGSQVYDDSFAGPGEMSKLLASVEDLVASKRKLKRAYVRRLALSSWSAGYGALRRILLQPEGEKVDSIILLDSLYGGYVHSSQQTIKASLLEPFTEFAKLAMSGRRFMYQTHSSIPTPGYASTQEVSHFMVKNLGFSLAKATRHDRLGLELIERFDYHDYHVRGYAGMGKEDHCAHLGILPDVIKAHLWRRWGKGNLNRRWRKPSDK